MRNWDMYHASYDDYVPREERRFVDRSMRRDVRRYEPRYGERFARPRGGMPRARPRYDTRPRYEPGPRHVEPRMVVPRGGGAR